MANPTCCEWLHQRLDALEQFSHPYDEEALPHNGIYFFYESGECSGHWSEKLRIVRVGTHRRNANFRERIANHFLLDERKMEFTRYDRKPSDRSVFRNHIGRALLYRGRDPYLSIWKINFTERAIREQKGRLRDIQKELAIEREVTRILRQNFYFKFIEINEQSQRMGSDGLEHPLIATLARCQLCSPSNGWLGRYSPDVEVRKSGMWQIQGLGGGHLSSAQKGLITNATERGDSRRDYSANKIEAPTRLPPAGDRKTNGTFGATWADISRRLRVGSTIRNWSADRRYTGRTFGISDVDGGGIFVKSDGMARERRVSKGDFQQLFGLWPDYRDGKIPRSDPRIMRSQNSTYVFSIPHWQEIPQG